MSSADIPLDQIPPTVRVRFERTLRFMAESSHAPVRILDLGPDNTLAEILRGKGCEVINTGGVDLDDHPEAVRQFDNVDCITSFELFEHLVAPYNVLRELPRVKMFITVPLRLWFCSAWRNPADNRDRHYHEFEPWQFDWVLDKAGWQIIRTEQWNSPSRRLGVRSLLRRLYPGYYALEVDPRERGAL